MARIDSVVADASEPPEYSNDDPPQHSSPSYGDAATQTDPPQELPPALSVSNPQASLPSALIALQVGASSPQAAADGVAPAATGGTSDTAAPVLPSSDIAETQDISTVIAPGETTHASTPPALTNPNISLEGDNSPFIDPDAAPVTPPSPPQSLAPIMVTPAPAAISTPHMPAQATVLPSPRSPSPGSMSSGSSSTSYGSWTSREAALAHDITAAFERLEFGDGAQAPNEELAIEAGDNEADQEGVVNEAGQEDAVAFFSDPDSDIEMMNAEDGSS
ncbi:hypothetical protein FRC05_008667 [Tulasnella sp. 425]|nr:hypothetical protein FRC05_008667 [Tulasnella sp. 425]